MTDFTFTPPLQKEIEIAVYGDASFKKDEVSQQGLVVTLRQTGSKKVNIISWKSSTTDRAAWSTVAAETFALQQALDRTIHVKNLLMEMGARVMKTTTLSDNLSLRRILYSGKSTKELRLRREVAAAGDLLTLDQIRVRYVPSEQMLADPMTETMTATNLLVAGRMNNLDRIDQWDKNVVSADEMLEAEIDIPMMELSKRLQCIQNQYNLWAMHHRPTRRVGRKSTREVNANSSQA